MNVIESNEYRDEVAALTADPIIRDMAANLPTGFSDFEEWPFILAASREYEARGGKAGFSIGGPAKAIAAIAQVQA